MDNLEKIAKEQGEAALKEQQNLTKYFLFHIIPTALWAAAVLFTEANFAWNSKDPIAIIGGLIAVVGAVIVTIKVYKNQPK